MMPPDPQIAYSPCRLCDEGVQIPFLAHVQLDVMDILNEYSPGSPINPFSEETEAQLRAL